MSVRRGSYARCIVNFHDDQRLTRSVAPASFDRDGRVIHIGSFSKTISPTLRLGFLVAPVALTPEFAEVAACLAPTPRPAVQLATAEFMHASHYIRHLRRTKRIYAAKRQAVLDCIAASVGAQHVAAPGLAVRGTGRGPGT